MDITLRRPEDSESLDELIGSTTNAKQRDRYRAIRLAVDGLQTADIQHALANRVFTDEQEIDHAIAERWNSIGTERLRTITATDWIKHEN